MASPTTSATTSLVDEELAMDFLDCARYGEIDDLGKMIKAGSVPIDFVDMGGNTALHKAAANGHAECVQLLLDAGASFLANESGNTPLHWAAVNGMMAVAELILAHFDENTVDVLQTNCFGQGALSEAFKSGNTDLVAKLLEHPSASEEKLMADGGLDGTGSTSKQGSKKKTKQRLKKEFAVGKLDSHVGRRMRLKGLAQESMNGREGVCVGEDNGSSSGKAASNNVVPRRVVVSLKPLAGENKAKSVKVKLKNVEWVGDDLDDEGGGDEGDSPNPPQSGSHQKQDEVSSQSVEHQLVLSPAWSSWSTRAEGYDDDDDDEVVAGGGGGRIAGSDSNPVAVASCVSSPSPPVVRIREGVIAHENPLGASAAEDTTGLGIWCASVILARWLADGGSGGGGSGGGSSGGSEDTYDAATTTTAAAAGEDGAAPLLRNRTFCELGAGCGVSGLAAARFAGPSLAVLTDLNAETLANLEHNAALLRSDAQQQRRGGDGGGHGGGDDYGAAATCAPQTEVRVQRLDWGDVGTWPSAGVGGEPAIAAGGAAASATLTTKKMEQQRQGFDVVAGSDLVYHQSVAPLLAHVVAGLLRHNGDFLYVAPAQHSPRRRRRQCPTEPTSGGGSIIEAMHGEEEAKKASSFRGSAPAVGEMGARAGLPAFLSSLQRDFGFRLVSARQAPKRYATNPLASRDATLGFLHFNELDTIPYMLYHFRKTGGGGEAVADVAAASHPKAAAPGRDASSSDATSNNQVTGSSSCSSCPVGHTLYSWEARNERPPPPLGHTTYSWPTLSSI